MKRIGRSTLVCCTFFMVVGLVASPPASAQEKKPNILFIMGTTLVGLTSVPTIVE